MIVLFKLALRNMATKKIRFTLLFLTFMFSAVAIMAAVFFKDTAIEAREAQLRDNTLNSQLVIMTADEQDFYFQAADVLDKIRHIEGIEHTVGRIGGMAVHESDGGRTLNVIGVDFPEQEKVYTFHYVERGSSQSGKELVISEAYSASNGLRLGDTIRLATAGGGIDFAITGIARSEGIFGNENLMFVSLLHAQELFDQPNMVYTIGVTINRLDRISAVVNDVRAAVGDEYLVDQRYDMEGYRTYVGTISMALNIFSAFMIFITMFLTYSTFRAILFERMSQIGILRSIGVSKVEIGISVYIENVLLVVVSTLIGVMAGFPFLYFILGMVAEGTVSIPFNMLKIAGVFLLLLLTGLVSVTLSVLKILRIPVVEIIKGSTGVQAANNKNTKHLAGFLLFLMSLALLILSEYMDNSLFYLIAGIIVFAVSFVILTELIHIVMHHTLFKGTQWFGPGARLLSREFKRDFSKSAQSIILISIVIGIAYLSFTLSHLVKESVDGVYQGVDLIVTTDATGDPLDVQLSSLDEVERTVSQLRANMRVHDMDVEITAVDPEAYSEISFEIFREGSAAEWFSQLDAGRNIIISTTFAQNTNTRVGDYIPLGSDAQQEMYLVIAVASSFENMGKVQFISRDNFVQDQLVPSSSFHFITINEGYSIAEAMTRISDSLGDSRAYNLVSLQQMKESNAAANNQLFLIVNLLFVLSIVISVFSLNNNLIINVLSKVKVFAIKRTIGMSLKQIFRNITGEGLVLGLEGGILGLMFGFGLNVFLVRILSHYIGDLSSGYYWPAYLLLLLASMCIGLLSSIYPFTRVRGMNMVQAIKGRD